MIYKTHSPLPHHVRVTFELPADLWAGQVYLVGDFNQWSARATPLVQERDGAWRATLDLPCDRCYEFRYLIDGQWRTDSGADHCLVHRCRPDLCLLIGNIASECPILIRCTRRKEDTEDKVDAFRHVENN